MFIFRAIRIRLLRVESEKIKKLGKLSLLITLSVSICIWKTKKKAKMLRKTSKKRRFQLFPIKSLSILTKMRRRFRIQKYQNYLFIETTTSQIPQNR